eukprot:UN24510
MLSCDRSGRLFKYNIKNEEYRFAFNRCFNSDITVMEVLDEKYYVVGFADGMVRIFECSASSFVLLCAKRIHDCGITHVKISKNKKCMATYAKDNTLFFLNITDKQDLEPLYFITTPEPIVSLFWIQKNESPVLCCVGKLIIYQYEILKDKKASETTYNR